MKKIGIIGAGIGGLATAARLSCKGYDVSVFEKLPECGGRCHMLEDSGFKIDMGPSFVLMPDLFREVFNYCGKDISQYLDLIPLDPSYKVFYPDGDCVTVFYDSQKTKQEIEKIEPGSSDNFDRFIDDLGKLYKAIEPLLYKCFQSKDILNPSYWPLLTKLKAFDTYWGLASKYFKSDKLRYLFTFEAMFMGVSPYRAPAFYSIISYADHAQKIFHPRGGMYEIAKSLEKIAKEFGYKWPLYAPVEHVHFFSSRSLQRLVAENGFEVIRREWRVDPYPGVVSKFSAYIAVLKDVLGLSRTPRYDIHYIYFVSVFSS